MSIGRVAVDWSMSAPAIAGSGLRCEHDAEVADSGEGVDPEVEDDCHALVVPDGALGSQVTKPTTFGLAINKSMGRIERADPDPT